MAGDTRKGSADITYDSNTIYPDLFYQSLFDHSPDIVFYLDIRGVIVQPNKRFSQVLGYDTKEIVLSTVEKFLSLENVSDYKEALDKALSGETQHLKTTFVHKSGSTLKFLLTLVPAWSENQVIGIFAIAKNVTKNVLLKHALKDSELLFESLVNEAPLGVFIIQNGKTIYGNPKLYQLLGIKRNSTGLNLWDYVRQEDKARINVVNHLEIGDKGVYLSFRIINTAGTQIEVIAHINKIIYQRQQTIVGSIQDITERKKAEEYTKYVANHDQLTGLPNRKQFEEKIQQEVVIGQTLQRKFAVMYIDIDRFKYINDALGHPIGDKLLIQFSKKLKELFDSSTILARISADSFILLFPDIVNTEQMIGQAKRIIRLSDTPFFIEDYKLFITVCIGISIFPNDGKDAEAIVKHADTALYKAKATGQSKYQIHTPTMDIESYKTFKLSSALRNPLTLNQFEIYYQPKVCTATHQITGAEALMRWHHPKWGNVFPDEFIPLAEELGIMSQIDQWIGQTVCKQNKAWQEAGLPAIPISINISAKRFLETEMMTDIAEVLAKNQLDPDYLEVEIVESTLLENNTAVVAVLDGLSKKGIKISLDDFGKGYSSLSYLMSFKGKINTLKIDKTFIDDLSDTADENSNFITKSIIELAQHLDMNVVAEGVETFEQLEILQNYKCNIIQGYLFSKPVPADAFAELLRKGKFDLPTTENTGTPTRHENRRKYFRIDLDSPLIGLITLIQFHGSNVQLGKNSMLIENIGLGGLRFLSDLHFGIDRKMILEINTKILGEIVSFHGSVVWMKELKSSIFQYGFEFVMNETERSDLAQLLNKLSILAKQKVTATDCSFVTLSVHQFFSEKRPNPDGLLE